MERNIFKKLDDGNWGVASNAVVKLQPGTVVKVTKRSGATKDVIIGELVGSITFDRDFFHLYTIGVTPEVEHAVASQEAALRRADEARGDVITSPGIFEHPSAGIFVVKPNRAKTRLYAKKLVPSTERLNDQGDPVDFDFEYAPGAMKFLGEGHRMDIERGKALTIRYGRCICCGRRLKVKASVERGIGPVCIKYFAAAPGYGQHTDLDDSPAPLVDEDEDLARRLGPEGMAGYHATRLAQEAGPAGSAEREAAFMEMEMFAYNHGLDD